MRDTLTVADPATDVTSYARVVPDELNFITRGPFARPYTFPDASRPMSTTDVPLTNVDHVIALPDEPSFARNAVPVAWYALTSGKFDDDVVPPTCTLPDASTAMQRQCSSALPPR